MSWLLNLGMLGTTDSPPPSVTGTINFATNCNTGINPNYQKLGGVNIEDFDLVGDYDGGVTFDELARYVRYETRFL